MAKKDVYKPHQDSSFNKAQGRQDGSAPKPDAAQRERNVGHPKAEEHNKSQQTKRGS